MNPEEMEKYITLMTEIKGRISLIDAFKMRSIMHSGNPYGSKIDCGCYETRIGEWRSKLVNLLNAHLIRVINDENIYLIQMGAKDASPAHDGSYHKHVPPHCVVWPHSTDDVSRIVRWVCERRVPVIPWGVLGQAYGGCPERRGL